MSAQEQEVIARREIELRRPDGTVSSVYIELMRPMQCSDSEDYRCRYRMSGLDHVPIERDAYGVDSLQALLLCIRMVSVDVEIARKQFDLTWLGTDENDLGFP